MAKRKLSVMVLVAALLSMAAVPAGLACKRHYRRVSKHCVVKKVVVSRARHYRRGGGLAAPSFTTLATLTENPTPQVATFQPAAIAPPAPWPPLNIVAINNEQPPIPQCAPAATACCEPNPCCDPCATRHGRRR